MGFRGEALASIAAVAQVALKSRRESDEVGTCIEIENSTVLKQEPVAAPMGTSIAMKNLFYNVPARRNFLKSNTAEMRHIVDEFIRVALAFPSVFFSLVNNGQQLFHLEGGTLKQRILQLLGNNYNAKLVSVKEETDYLNIYGFVGKPETAKKTRGDQYFFVNNRFIKSAYLNHALQSAYQDMIPADSFPMYVLFIDLDPTQVDVNVHPTKQEIKFEDEKIIYAFVQAAVKHALAQFSIMPTLDFNLNADIQGLSSIQQPFTEQKQSAAQGTSIFQTFTEANQAHKIEPDRSSGFKQWSEYSGQSSVLSGSSIVNSQQPENSISPSATDNIAPANNDFAIHHPIAIGSPFTIDDVKLSQLFHTYILLPLADKFLLVHQQSAHERIIYEQLIKAMDGKPVATQRSLFPTTIELAPADAVLLQELLTDLQQMGYMIEPFGKNTFIIQGIPADVGFDNEKVVLERILEQYKHFSTDLKFSKKEMLIRSVAGQQAIKGGTPLAEKEMHHLLQQLFDCTQPNSTPSGKPTYMEFKKDQLDKLFGR